MLAVYNLNKFSLLPKSQQQPFNSVVIYEIINFLISIMEKIIEENSKSTISRCLTDN